MKSIGKEMKRMGALMGICLIAFGVLMVADWYKKN